VSQVSYEKQADCYVVCRYYFKRACDDFNSGFVYEELTDDVAELPLIDNKICAKVVRMST